jgi:hypothetical protein
MKISWVLTTRNDGYGGVVLEDRNFTMDRLETTIVSIKILSQKVGIESEIVVVEYNPPLHMPRIKDLNRFEDIRIVTVGAELNRLLDIDNKETLKIPFYEFVAKDIGIRRSSNEIVIACNPDNIFSCSGWHFVSNDINAGAISLGFRLEVNSIDLYNYGISGIIDLAEKRQLPFFNISPCAAGDFIAITKDIYNRAGRYDMLHGLWGLDGSFIQKAAKLGIGVRQNYWHYHIHHQNAICETRGSLDFYSYKKIGDDVITRFDDFVTEDIYIPRKGQVDVA